MAESEARTKRKARIFRIIYQQARNSLASVRKKKEKLAIKTVFQVVGKKTKQALLVDHFVTSVGRMQRKTKLRERLRQVGRDSMGRERMGRESETEEELRGLWKVLRKKVLDMRDELLDWRTEFDPEDHDADAHLQESIALLEEMERTASRVQRCAAKLLRVLDGRQAGYDRVMTALEDAEHLALQMDAQTQDLCDMEDWEPLHRFWRQQGEAKITLFRRALKEVEVIEEERERNGDETDMSEEEMARRQLTPKMQNLAQGMLNQLLDLRESEDWREQPSSKECNSVVLGLLRSASVEKDVEEPRSDSECDSGRSSGKNSDSRSSSRKNSIGDEAKPVVIYKEDETEFEEEVKVKVPILEEKACAGNLDNFLEKHDDQVCDSERASNSADDDREGFHSEDRPESLDVQFQEDDIEVKQEEVVPFAVQASWSREHLEPEPEKRSRWWKLRFLYRGAAAFLQASRSQNSTTPLATFHEPPPQVQETHEEQESMKTEHTQEDTQESVIAVVGDSWEKVSNGSGSASIVKLPNIPMGSRISSKRSNDSESASIETSQMRSSATEKPHVELPPLALEAPRSSSADPPRSRQRRRNSSPARRPEDVGVQSQGSLSQRRASFDGAGINGAMERRTSPFDPNFTGVIGGGRRRSLPAMGDGPRATAMGRPPRLFARRSSNPSQSAKEAKPHLKITG